MRYARRPLSEAQVREFRESLDKLEAVADARMLLDLLIPDEQR